MRENVSRAVASMMNHDTCPTKNRRMVLREISCSILTQTRCRMITSHNFAQICLHRLTKKWFGAGDHRTAIGRQRIIVDSCSRVDEVVVGAEMEVVTIAKSRDY